MGRQRAPDYDKKRAAIRDVAAKLFAEHGFDGSSIAELAERCGLTKPALYHYFPSKEALLHEILEEHIGALRRQVLAADAEARAWEPERRLAHVVRHLLAAYRDADDEHKVQLNELDRLPAEQRQGIKRVEREIVDVVAGILLLLNPRLGDGLLKPVAMSLFGALNWHYTWFRDDGAVSRAAYADLASHLFAEGVKALP